MMETRRAIAKAVAINVGKEHAHGLRKRVRLQPRGSGIFSMDCPCAKGRDLLVVPSALAGEGVGPSGGRSVNPMLLSNFRLSKVSDLFLISYLAEVKLPFSPWLEGIGEWAVSGLQLSVSSAEPDNLLLIEPHT